MKILTSVAAIILSVVGSGNHNVAGQRQFPKWRGRQTTLSGLWQATPIVVIGRLRDVGVDGIQSVDGLPWPVEQDIRKLYWCRGKLQVEDIIKGTVASGQHTFLWASVSPGCQLHLGRQANSSELGFRVWFVREEDGLLRPTFDGGSRYFLNFRTGWNGGSRVAPLE